MFFSCHAQSEWTLYSWLNVKEPLARNRGNIWSLSDWNRTRPYNHLVRKRTIKHLAFILTFSLKYIFHVLLLRKIEANFCLFPLTYISNNRWKKKLFQENIWHIFPWRERFLLTSFCFYLLGKQNLRKKSLERAGDLQGHIQQTTGINKRLWHMCFPVNFAKFLKTIFLQNTSWRLLLPCAVTLS